MLTDSTIALLIQRRLYRRGCAQVRICREEPQITASRIKDHRERLRWGPHSDVDEVSTLLAVVVQALKDRVCALSYLLARFPSLDDIAMDKVSWCNWVLLCADLDDTGQC